MPAITTVCMCNVHRQIPLSYGSMVGGMCSLLGTSVNLVAASLLEAYDPKQVRTGTK